jgi:hypothetical protein
MATPQQGDALSTAKKVLAGANKFEKSADPTGALVPKSQPTSTAVKAKAPMTPTQHSGSVQDLNHQTAEAEGAKYGMKGVPVMHTGGIVQKDGPVILQKGEKVIPASGRQSHYRDVFEERGRQGLHKYGQSAKQQTRQVGGNTPVKGEEHVKGSKEVKKQVGEPNEKSKD